MQMDSLNFFDFRAEKANAMQKHRQLQKMASLFRVIEVCVVLVLIYRLYMHLPFAVNNSGGYFHDMTVSFVNPGFVFIIGNAIIFTLFAKSGQFSARDCTTKPSGFDLYQEFIKNREKNQKFHPEETWLLYNHSISDQSKAQNYRRTQSYSQISNSRVCEKSPHVLRRLETQKCRKSSYSEDEMSNEEFQRKVEAFISRQQRLRREEEYSRSLCI
ncbi:uncharacterized protein LOC132167554 [Corylus avellana]|uniref:uncharacterized protein LOC132167554 n=1 Tax=Corylus avellana TaxID=13451 RepID=UPI00286C35E9|nr:uncharacterized protein LOC132167554 [Corylus avellana]